jgi:hypothetical protein
MPWKEMVYILVLLMPVAVTTIVFRGHAQDIISSIFVIALSGMFSGYVLFVQYKKRERYVE